MPIDSDTPDPLTAALQAMVSAGPLPMPDAPRNRKERRAAAKAKPAKGRGAGKAPSGGAQDLAAIANYRHSLALNPLQPDTHYNMGNALRRTARHADAALAYGEALRLRPGFADAHNNLGISLQELGRFAQAIAHFGKTLELQTGYPGAVANLASAHSNYGNELLGQQRPEEAAGHYGEALRLRPDFAEAHYNLGTARKSQGRAADAVAHFRQAIAIRPSYAHAHNNLGATLRVLGQLPEAIMEFRLAMQIEPGLHEPHINLGTALYLLGASGQQDAAIAAAREWAAQHPGNAIAQHTLAALAQDAGAAPARASDAYVETLFDDFAARFDATLSGIGYRGPALVDDLLERELPARGLDVLDAGCGTGLSGIPLRARARSLAGVDLSARMLAKAAERGIYDQLHRGELTAFLASRPAAFDLVVAADVLDYFGDLSSVMAAAAGALRPGGALAFTVEAPPGQPGQGWRLLPHGRYCHAATYVQEVVAQAGLSLAQLEPAVIRVETGRNVNGFTALARKPA
ncbi:MAG: tetratricopeptide repeat protein [Burkholderiales bacterium]|nr:tetratricopeptide repeat protein [Burkholderiales bacterium]